MTMEEIFGIESDEEYFARPEEERILEVAKYIAWISIEGNYEEGWSIESHINSLLKEGVLNEESANKVMDKIKEIIGFN